MPETVPIDPLVAALDVLNRQGYEVTTVAEIADATRISRSTFFRRFGSKEDVIFHDHELLLDTVERHLATTTADPLEAVTTAARMVFDHHVTRREVSVPRYALLQTVPALRAREIVTANRYQNLLVAYLRRALPDTPERYVGSLAYAAAIVAVHNSVLQHWLGDPARDGSVELVAQLQVIVSWFRPLLLGQTASHRVAVVAIPEGAGNAEILGAIRAAGIS
ncbi:MAG TPA: helix-turn-helix domain-containing protein [Microlunatus sp.]